MTKAELRKEYLERRKSITESAYFQLNRAITERFFSSTDLSFVKVVHSFLPIAANREFDTWLILDRIRREFPHVRLSIPRINKSTGLLDNFYFEGLHQLESNNWGIQQPRQGIPTEHEKIDLVLVPLLAFDKTGHRVGYGKGYYDKFLATCRHDCQKVGVSFFSPIEKIADTSSTDYRLTSCLTPERKFTFG